MKTFLFELCAESLEAAEVAQAAGAGRVELCSNLAVGGVTPAPGLIEATVRALQIPVHVLIRPRPGSFFYSPSEFAQMRAQVRVAKAAGAAGLAVGVLQRQGRIDVERNRELVEMASPMNVTFHRAFDETPDLEEALEDVIRSGADCLLTSGGAPNVLAGAESIGRLCRQAENRLDVMAGGGLRLETLVEAVRRSGVSHLHGSMLRRHAPSGSAANHGKPQEFNGSELEADVREAIGLFAREVAARAMTA